MILVYARNKDMDEVADLPFDGKVGYRNPQYWNGEVEDCEGCYVHGDYPELKKAYKDKLIRVDDSTDYTIAELRAMKDDIDDWEAFTANDNRSSIDNL